MFLHGREDETTSTTSNASSDAEYDNLQIYNMDSMKLLDVLDIPIRLVSFNPLAMKNYWGNKAMLDANRMTLEDYQRIDMHAMTSPQMLAWNKEVFEAVQVKLRTIRKQRTVYPKGKPLNMDMLIKPVRVKLESGMITDPICFVQVKSIKNAEQMDNGSRAHDLLNFTEDCMTLINPINGSGVHSNLSARTWYMGKRRGPKEVKASKTSASKTSEAVASLDQILKGLVWKKEGDKQETKRKILSLREGSPVLTLNCLSHAKKKDDNGQPRKRTLECRWVPDESTECGLILIADKDVSQLVNTLRDLQEEIAACEGLMYSMIPATFCDHVMKEGTWPRAKMHKGVTFMVMSLTGYKQMNDQCDSRDLVLKINELYEMYDVLVSRFPSVTKVITSCDMYCVCGGLNYSTSVETVEGRARNSRESLADVLQLADEMRRLTKRVQSPLRPDRSLMAQIGVHLGDFASGTVGRTQIKVFGVGVEMTKVLSIGVARQNEIVCTPSVYETLKDDPSFDFSESMMMRLCDFTTMDCHILNSCKGERCNDDPLGRSWEASKNNLSSPIATIVAHLSGVSINEKGDEVRREKTKLGKSNSLASTLSDSSNSTPVVAVPSQQDVERYKAKSGLRKSDSINSASGNDTPTSTVGNLHEAEGVSVAVIEGLAKREERNKSMPNLLTSNSFGSDSTATSSCNGNIVISEVAMTDSCSACHINTTGYPY